MNSGIYKIENTVDRKVYIGCALRLKDREKRHWAKLRIQKHKNIHLQRAYNLYGESAFTFEVLEECDIEYLYSMEHYWATVLDAHNPKCGYNIRPTNPYGTPQHSKETIDKISAKIRGRKRTEEVKKGMRGWKHTQESKEKIAEAGKGRVFTQETKDKIAQKQREAAKRKGLLTEEEKKNKAKERSNQYSKSEKGKEVRRKSKEKWKEKNKEKLLEQARIYDKKRREKNKTIKQGV